MNSDWLKFANSLFNKLLGRIIDIREMCIIWSPTNFGADPEFTTVKQITKGPNRKCIYIKTATSQKMS